jgi:hypothetical protein
MRALLTAWQSGPEAGVPAGQLIVTADHRRIPLAEAETPAAALHAFAVTVLSGGFAHPWPAPAGPADLTLILAAMAGIELDPAAIPTAQPQPSLGELIADRDRLTRELAQARARHDFYERTIADRERSPTATDPCAAPASSTPCSARPDQRAPYSPPPTGQRADSTADPPHNPRLITTRSHNPRHISTRPQHPTPDTAHPAANLDTARPAILPMPSIAPSEDP